ncbi:hypothetical protein TNCV_4216771 [Trichonephila clavipes]|nr:hypothetical protein TNCV_4216771 [Trichonephila clavipes]
MTSIQMSRVTLANDFQGQFRATRPVACIPLTPFATPVFVTAHWRTDLLCFLMKAGSVLMSVMTEGWSKGGQGNFCKQTVYGLDTLGLHLQSWSENKFLLQYPFNHDDAINIERKRGTSPVLDVTDRQEWLSPSATSRSSENNLQH